jgi:hypothetical protein
MECTKLYVFAELEPMAIHPQVPDTMEGWLLNVSLFRF